MCAIKLMSFFTTRHAPNDKLKNYHSSEFIKYDVDVLVRLSSGTKNAPCRKGKSKIISLVFQEGSISFLFQIYTINEMVCHFIEQPRRPPAAQRLVSFHRPCRKAAGLLARSCSSLILVNGFPHRKRV